MQVLMNFPPGTKAEEIRNAAGELVGVTLTPFFTSSRGFATAVTGQTGTSAGQLLDEFEFQVSGITGRIKRSRQEPVTPQCDKQCDKQLAQARLDLVDPLDEDDEE
jgi:hypothetical protein